MRASLDAEPEGFPPFFEKIYMLKLFMELILSLGNSGTDYYFSQLINEHMTQKVLGPDSVQTYLQ